MKTVLIVDGYNAINAIPETKKLLKENLLSARSKIIMITQEYVRSSGYITDFCVVFDGRDEYRYLDRIHVPFSSRQTFSGTGEGDDKIIETIRQYSSRAGVRVVVASNDNYVRNNARGYRASLVDSEDLAGKRTRVENVKREAKSGRSDKKISKDVKDRITREYKKELGL
jgi:uncharacterized protein